jgi:hypothetical protein
MNKKKMINQSRINVPQKSRLKKCTCPYWAASSRACLLVKEGLFLPLQQHVDVYCLSSRYPSCRHYLLLAEAQNKTIQERQEQTSAISRRRSIRIPSHYSFRFSEITANDQLPGLQEDDAWTIDLSDHGIRFASRQWLTPDTVIRFFLILDDSNGGIEKTGRVIWCEPLENMPLYHAGIAFPDRKVHS